MAAKQPSKRSHNRRSVILDGALQCFLAKGFESTSVEDIGAASGASIGSIYHHFGSKEGMVAALYLETLTGYYDDLDLVLERCHSIEAVVKMVVSHHIDWSIQNPNLARYLLTYRRYSTLAPLEEQIEELTRSKLRLLLDELQSAVARREVLPLPNSAYIAIVIGPCLEVVRLWAFNRLRGNITEVRDALAEAAWRSLRYNE